MTPVTVGMIAGAFLILTAAAVFWSKKNFPAGGIVITLVGFLLIGMSLWSNIKITAAGATIEVVRAEIRQTAAATEEVAAQAQQAVAALEATKQQVASLTSILETRNVLPGSEVQRINAGLAAVPHVDVHKLGAARATLSKVVTH
jgi:hypothetical protein